MYKYICILLCSMAFVACNSPAPQQYYNKCVLSTTYLQHFGSAELQEWLSQPAKVYDPKTQGFKTVTYRSIIREKYEYNEKMLAGVQKLKVTGDAADMIKASEAVYRFVIERQKADYMRIAGMKDAHMADSLIVRETAQIDMRYGKTFQALLNTLWGYGKIYADAHALEKDSKSVHL